MRLPRKSVFVALLVIFSPGIAFALFELFFFTGPIKVRSRLAAWAFLAIGLACVLGLLFHLARDTLPRVSGSPRFRWVLKWGVSVASLASGLVTLLVFRRGLPGVAWLVGYLLLLWLIFAVFTQVRAPLEARGRHLVLSAVDYMIQTLYHNLLLFVLPAYYASATLTSVNAWFLLMVAGGALVTAVDPWYRSLIHPRQWLNHALLAFSMFAALNVALPLVGIRPFWALEGSAVLCALALIPALRRAGGSWRGARVRAAIFAVLAVLLLLPLRSGIPPAPLHLARAVLAQDVDGLEPVGLLEGPVRAADLETFGGLVAYTAIYAPAGLREPVFHVWKKNGVPVDTVPLSPVKGGRAEGFRTYSRKTALGPSPEGQWTVDVVTAHGQLIGRLSFDVVW